MTLRFLFYLTIILIGATIGAARFKYISAPFKVLTTFLFVTFLSELISRIVALKIQNSSPVYHFYVILLIAFLSSIYFLLMNKKRIQIFIAFACSLFIILSSINSLFFQPLLTFPSFSIVSGDILVILFSLLLFKYLLDNELFINKRSVIALNFTILFYFTIQLFNWGFYNYLLRNNLNSKIISDLGYLANILFYTSLGIILLMVESKNKSKNVSV